MAKSPPHQGKSSAKKSGETPLMKQFNAIKAKHPDAILLFRVGDFYETLVTMQSKPPKCWALCSPNVK